MERVYVRETFVAVKKRVKGHIKLISNLGVL